MRILIVSRPSSTLLGSISEAIGRVPGATIGKMETISSLPDETQLAAADLVIVVLDSPDQYTEDQIEDALANSPLTR